MTFPRWCTFRTAVPFGDVLLILIIFKLSCSRRDCCPKRVVSCRYHVWAVRSHEHPRCVRDTKEALSTRTCRLSRHMSAHALFTQECVVSISRWPTYSNPVGVREILCDHEHPRCVRDTKEALSTRTCRLSRHMPYLLRSVSYL